MDKQKQALAITKALAYTENGGKPEHPESGHSGEMKSIFQFTPGTWKLYAKQVLGDENTPLTSENEAEVVHKKVSDWLDNGYNTEQIASMWNAGERKPDAYKENWKGTNKYGIDYDTPAYAKKVSEYAKKFESEQSSNAPQDKSSEALKKLMEFAQSKQTMSNMPQQPAQQKPQLSQVSNQSGPNKFKGFINTPKV